MSSVSQSRDIADRYQLREALAKRPVGRWFRAFDREVDVDVGLLLVNPELLPDEASQNRFMGAVVEMRGINHRHLLRLFDVGREGDSVYLTTQMSQPIKALYKAEGVLDYVNSVADALDAVHRAGQTHGRLTPSDIGEVQKLIKVSGAGLYSDIPPAVAMRVWRGLSCFWAPEIVRGEHPTPAADVYSLAAIAVVLLSSGKTADPHRALEGLKKENRAVYDALAPAMSVTPDDRPASPSLLVNRLANALDDEEIDEQETTYFVKSSLDEIHNIVSSKPSSAPIAPADKPVSGDEATVLDVSVPAEVARVQAPPTQSPAARARIAELVGDAKKAKRADLAKQAQQAKASNLEKRAEAKKAGKLTKPSVNHDRTVVDRTTLPKGPGNERKVPSIVMGPPVGSASAPSRGKGKGRAQGDDSGVPQALPINDETEKMSAEHLPVGGFSSFSKKAPPAMVASSWVAHATKPALPTRTRAPSPPVIQAATAAMPDDGGSAAGQPPAEPDQLVQAQPVVRRPRSVPPAPVQPVEAISLGPAPSQPADQRPQRAASAPAVMEPNVEPPMSRPASVQEAQRPPMQPQLPQMQPQLQMPVQHPAQQPAQQPVQQLVMPHTLPNTHRVPGQPSNLTWLYLILAAIASATLAILVAMALFGD